MFDYGAALPSAHGGLLRFVFEIDSSVKRRGGSHGLQTSPLQQIADLFDSAIGIVQDWDYANAKGTAFNLSFLSPGTTSAAVAICLAQPELCSVVLAGGAVYSVYVAAKYVPALIDAIKRGITSRDAAPVRYDPYPSVRDEDGNCPPPDPDKFVNWRGTGNDHWHWIDWNQRLVDCVNFPVFQSGPDDPGPRYREIPR